MKTNKLQEKYEKIVNDYITIFCKKQEVNLEYWIADIVGGIADFGDVIVINFSDIIYDINTNQPKGLIIDWIYDSLDNADRVINYYSYSKGLRYDTI